MTAYRMKTVLRCCRGAIRAVLGAAFAACILASCGSLTYDVRITSDDINRRLADKFPVTKTYLLLFRTTFSNPRVTLHDDTDRVTVGLDVGVEAPSRRQPQAVSGAVTVTSGLQFNNKTGQLFLKDPVVENLSLTDAGGRELEIREMLGVLLQGYLARMPVYTIRATDVKKSIEKLMVKDVRIQNGVIIVTLGG